MAEKANQQTKKHLSHLNFVHNDEIWKSHIHHEVQSKKYKWPNQWGYLVEEYNALTLKLRDLKQVPSPKRASNLLLPPINKHTQMLSSVLETTSPLIGRKAGSDKCSSSNLLFPPIKRHAKMLRSVPETTSQLIGWKIGNDKCRLEIHGQSPESCRRRGILKILKWPDESQP